MNIHEHQAKEILREFGAPVSNGVVILSTNEIDQKMERQLENQFGTVALPHMKSHYVLMNLSNSS